MATHFLSPVFLDQLDAQTAQVEALKIKEQAGRNILGQQARQLASVNTIR